MPPSRHFRKLLEHHWSEGRFACVGLDSELEKTPPAVQHRNSDGSLAIKETIVAFNRAIIEATHDLICAYKPNTSFYEAHGLAGIAALEETMRLFHTIAPNVPIILDAKRGDIGNTNNGYIASAFDHLKADAITLHPYMGKKSLQPFLDRADKGIIILCRTSNEGADEFQNLSIDGEELYKKVARQISSHWNQNNNCGLVVGATCPNELREVRQIVDTMPLLIPGIGAQGGSVEETVRAAKDSHGAGMIINSSRGIIFASKEKDFAEAARRETDKLHHLIHQIISTSSGH
ncbi:MAG: orotidine-5'-phosphate decarboxylase [Verrucomicrobiae bacterium]|nr:orotidine-5'-phosphate decarboxylase [Verrucomicrobiae bacterium]